MHERLDILWDIGGLVVVFLMAMGLNLCNKDFNEYLFTAQHAWFILVSLGDAWASVIVLVDLLVLSYWLWSVGPCNWVVKTTWLRIVLCSALPIILNRQAAYIMGLGVWGTLIFSFADSLGSLIIGIALLVFGIPLIANLVTYLCIKNRIKSQVLWEHILLHRRPGLNGITLLGLVCLMVVYPCPKEGLLWLTIFAFLTTFIRMIVGLKDSRGDFQNGSEKEDAGSIRGKLWLIAQDAPVIILVPILMLGISVQNIGRELEANEEALKKRVDDSYPEKNQYCPPRCTSSYSQVSDQQDWDASLFLVADNQFRALDGKSSTGHTSLINKLVPVAQRPVELDLLSGVTLANFGKIYQRMLRTGFNENLRWVHLGDFADLACQSELDRMDALLKNFGENPVGFAPGNHDKFFTGNFSWHPDWSKGIACPKRPLSHESTNKTIHDSFYQPTWVEGFSSLDDGHDFLTRIAKLTKDGSIVAVFLDSSDYNSTWFGVAGVLGHVSDDQAQWVNEKLSKKFPDAYVVLLAHHPLESIDSGFWSSGIDDIINELSGRLIAFVGAHTHLSQYRLTSTKNKRNIFDSMKLSRYRDNPRDKLSKEPIRQFIVGSTTDAPQEAAILRIRIRSDSPEIRFETIPSVSKNGLSPCGVPTVSADFCKDVLRQMGDCRRRVLDRIKQITRKEDERSSDKSSMGQDRFDCKTCREDERSPDNCFRDQKHAFTLLKCVENQQNEKTLQQNIENGTFETECPLDDKHVYARFYRNRNNHEHLFVSDITMQKDRAMDRLVCLSWAASILQQQKHKGWDFQDALFRAHTKLEGYSPWHFDSEYPKKQ